MEALPKLTRIDACRLLLGSARISDLQRRVKADHDWAIVFHGFRPQTLTRSTLTRFAPVFARSPRLHSPLQHLLLDGLAIPAGEDLSTRWKRAVENQALPGELAGLGELLSETPLQDLPQAPSEPTQPLELVSEAQRQEMEAPSQVELGAHPVRDEEDSASRALPSFVLSREDLVWNEVKDDSSKAQEATTRFERCMLAFMTRQLQGLHGDAWLRKGCGPWRKEWRKREPDPADPRTDQSLEPSTLLGYAHVTEYPAVITYSDNWQAFEPYFIDKEWFVRTYEQIFPIRLAGSHAADRNIQLVGQASRLNAMIQILECFNRPTAEGIAEIYESVLRSGSIDSEENAETEFLAVNSILTNIAEFSNPELVGREEDLRKVNEFWQDEFSRILSITGQGGVGKTALLDGFIWDLLNRPMRPGETPIPEAIVYLTAKENYLDYMTKAPSSRKFATARRIFEASLEIMGEEPSESSSDEELRRKGAPSCERLADPLRLG